jgi:hypothetical protein
MRFIAYDLKLKRPGCVLLQAVMGGDARAASQFDPKKWLLAPTPDLKLYPLTDEVLEKLLEIS